MHSQAQTSGIEDVAEAEAIGIPSTPAFFINGHYIGPLPKDGLDRLIDQELEARR